MLGKCFQAIKTYWLVIIIGGGVAGMLIFMSNQSKVVAELESDIETIEELLVDAEKNKVALEEEFDAKAHQQRIKERTVSAEEIGKEIIEVDDVLTAFYKTNEPLPEDKKERDALFARLEEAKKKNTELTGATEADHIKTWQLNPQWTLTLESVLAYQQDSDRFPVLFLMETGDGKSAGLIYATYDVTNHTLSNISRHYTTDGLKDEVDVGGI
ncbi:hypothetical protein CHH61_03740 [Shouchella clausii]|uniref:Uncharacterized protein n=1 Tax=Shouchella clausii TaxID=79880 RepID=A0A268S4A3_SHOCL|nr:hypothetical protein [Shouchella clausii]PAF27345.1 hypothetical protein CHH61_03740 [Shouchella clausii]